MCSVWMRAEPRRSACWPTSRATSSPRRAAAGANLQAVGELEVEKVLHDVMEEAIGDRPIVPAAICLGIAGVDRPNDSAIVRGIMKRIGHKARVLIVNDALVALEAGAPGQPGVVVISGTGSICVRAQRGGRGGPIGRMGLRARRRGQRLLDWPRGAARGPARVGQRGPADGAVRSAAGALRRHAGPGADSRGLQREPEAGRDRRARPVRADGLLRR